jgi:hypothetical protein
MAVIQYLEH